MKFNLMEEIDVIFINQVEFSVMGMFSNCLQACKHDLNQNTVQVRTSNKSAFSVSEVAGPLAFNNFMMLLLPDFF